MSLSASEYFVGKARITQVHEQIFELPGEKLYPKHWNAQVCESVTPAGMDVVRRDGQIVVPMSVHSWVVRTPTRTIIIDTATGNHKQRSSPLFDQLDTEYPARLAEAGVDPAEVDLVLLTHLHADHVGWNTRLEGDDWVPMFPNATYVFSRQGYENWLADETRHGIVEDSITPIMSQAKLFDSTQPHEVGEGIRFLPTPGHSHDHCSIELVSDGQTALFSGDLMHHPVQVTRPDWTSMFCEKPDLAEESRRWALDYCMEREAIYFSSHFTGTGAGRVKREGTDLIWRQQ